MRASTRNYQQVGATKGSAPRDPHSKGCCGTPRLDDKTVTRWARQGYIPAHPLGEGKRKVWRFIESELIEWLAAQTNQLKAA